MKTIWEGIVSDSTWEKLNDEALDSICDAREETFECVLLKLGMEGSMGKGFKLGSER